MPTTRMPFPSVKRKRSAYRNRFDPRSIAESKSFNSIDETCPIHECQFSPIRDFSEDLYYISSTLVKSVEKADRVISDIRYKFRDKLIEAWEVATKAQDKANEIFEELKEEKAKNKKLLSEIKKLEKKLERTERKLEKASSEW